MLFKWIQETIALLLLYLLMHQCHVFDMDTFYFSSLNDVNSFRKFCPVSLSRCIYECKIRARCEAINYSKMWKLCSLISGPLITSGDSQIGFVHGRKAEWDMVIHLTIHKKV